MNQGVTKGTIFRVPLITREFNNIEGFTISVSFIENLEVMSLISLTVIRGTRVLGWGGSGKEVELGVKSFPTHSPIFFKIISGIQPNSPNKSLESPICSGRGMGEYGQIR